MGVTRELGFEVGLGHEHHLGESLALGAHSLHGGLGRVVGLGQARCRRARPASRRPR